MKNLKEDRKAAGFRSQLELSRAAAVPLWRISQAEIGGLDLKPEEVVRIRQALIDAAKRNIKRIEGMEAVVAA
jgi:predicted transcriptional regulator